MPLSDTATRQAKPKEKTYKIADADGMYLFVTPAGGKLWRMDYRFDGKRRTLALGAYPEISLAMARERRTEARRLLAQGVDPMAARRESKGARGDTFAIAAEEWFAVWRGGKSASHIDDVRGRLTKHLLPQLGGRPVAEINAPEVLAVLRGIEARGTIEAAKRAKTIISQVMRYAIATGKRIERDPCPDLQGALKTAIKRHMPTLTDPASVAELLRAIESYAMTPRVSLVVASALRLAPLVFVRPGELRRARWPEIDLDGASWRYTASKTSTEHEVPLSRQALAILRRLYPMTGGEEFCFPGGRPGRPMSDAAINRALQTMGYDTKTEITGHGFRAMARTMLAERLYFPPEVIEHQLAHRVPDTLGAAYNRTKYLAQRREMMQAWADYLDHIKQIS
jgi:integrase